MVHIVFLIGTHPVFDQVTEADSAWSDKEAADKRCAAIASEVAPRCYRATVVSLPVDVQLKSPKTIG